MNIFSSYLAEIKQEIIALEKAGAIPTGLDLWRVTAEPPRDPSHGDISTNAAMVLGKSAGMNPKAFAELLLPGLKKLANVESVAVAGPGFINLKLKPVIWTDVLAAILSEGAKFGSSSLGKGQRVNVEYVSANPTGPLHVGHCRGAVFGDALASLLEFAGYGVVREYYINDAGAQVDVLARSAHLRYREALGETINEIPAGLYPGDYLKPVGAALAERFGNALLDKPEAEWLPVVRETSIAMMMDLIREDLAALNIKQEVFSSEKALHTSGAVDAATKELEQRDLIYKGRLPPPKGELPEDWEDREQTLFRSTQYGDDTDRPLKKSDGSYTYFASDVAYAKDKVGRDFQQLIYVLGADHGGYVKRLQAVVAAVAGNKKVETIVRLCQLVKLFRNGEPVRMSKRAGEFVTLRELVDEVGPDVIRFMMLYRKNEAPLDFDFAKVTEQSKDNPVFYVHYAHARICRTLRKAEEQGITLSADGAIAFDQLNDESEIALTRRLAEFPRQIEAAALAHEPHRISFYLYEIAGEFNSLYNRGKELPQLRFIVDGNRELTRARLSYLVAIRTCLANGLRVLGVTPITEM
jgi:arginyl-tRNA synthetase